MPRGSLRRRLAAEHAVISLYHAVTTIRSVISGDAESGKGEEECRGTAGRSRKLGLSNRCRGRRVYHIGGAIVKLQGTEDKSRSVDASRNN